MTPLERIPDPKLASELILGIHEIVTSIKISQLECKVISIVGGQRGTMVYILASEPSRPGSIPSIPKKFQRKK